MTIPFVWFDNLGPARSKTTDFLKTNFGWSDNDIGPMTFLTNGTGAPFAATCDAMPGVQGWVPYIEVDDLSEATARATQNGAEIVAQDLQGPAGVATFIKDPGGAALALWKRAEGM
ncbi:hypothetical protein [Shimia sp.]|uniref:VOC family protein n=1 Tax=Shimia sp. TaxID=1954381 RepID=UPI00329858EA